MATGDLYNEEKKGHSPGGMRMIKLNQLDTILAGPSAEQWFHQLYGSDPAVMPQQQARYRRLGQLFAAEYPHQPAVRLFSTPGRTEVGGNHTDHQQGRVLCAAVDLDIIAMAAPNQAGVIRLRSEGYASRDEIDLADLTPQPAELEKSASLIRGVAAGLAARGVVLGGCDIFTSSRVPKGSGLSSSAAFEVLLATILDGLFNQHQLTAVEKALIAQAAENKFFGKPSGLMDQCGCAVGGFIAIDFADPRQPVVEPIASHFDEHGYCLVITNTGGSHADLTDEYASVPRDMKQVAAALGQSVLRAVDETVFWQELPRLRALTGDKALLRAMHFFQDNNRVAEQAAALREDRFADFLALVKASGLSSWTLLQNVHASQLPAEQPIALGLALSERLLAGRGASRVHGGGFAGTIQSYVPLELADTYLAGMAQLFGSEAPWRLRIRERGTCELQLEP